MRIPKYNPLTFLTNMKKPNPSFLLLATKQKGHLEVLLVIFNNVSFQIASGYADGSIRIWDSEKGTCETTLNGHKGAVTTLRYNKLSSLLASGSKDNDVILWDVVGETGLFRLRGHRDQVCI